MIRPSVLDQLQDHHTAVLAILTAKQSLLQTIGVGTVGELARVRWTLVRALTAYRLFKHQAIFDPLLPLLTGAPADRLRRAKAACDALDEDFRAYVQRWSAADVQAQWDVCEPATRAMIVRIRDHLARERADLTLLVHHA